MRVLDSLTIKLNLINDAVIYIFGKKRLKVLKLFQDKVNKIFYIVT